MNPLDSSDRPSALLAFGGTPAERDALRTRVAAAGGEAQDLDLLFPEEGCVALTVPLAVVAELVRELEAAGLRIEDATGPFAALDPEETP